MGRTNVQSRYHGLFPHENPNIIFQMVESMSISFGETTALRDVPKFEDSKWHRAVDAQRVEDEAEGKKRDAKIHVILQKRHDARVPVTSSD